MSSLIESTQSTVDSWLTAICAWTQDVVGSEWSLYNGVWPTSYIKPAIMWRVTGMDVRVLGLSSYEIEKRLTATVLADDPTDQNAVILQLIEELGAAVKIPLHAAERRFLSISEPKGNLNANVNTTGTAEAQITVTCTQRTGRRPVKEISLMQSVNYKSNMR
ncbi:hypothetical protein EJP82_11295 [Paenibacillus anaericanus]|uniref:Uncharacterized protein n=1 Tax=Paenibacillus anaericanus TaxID=170367 RepID=A0A433Y965_9BACL|nr:hypothetical protein [Paenibacillus anaericanus]RUT46431.1 hypothetical protein EJP82_11295 [Paenibacillus anaericanus]